MALRCGIVGLPNVGKSTIFNALTGGGATVANYPFTTIDPNIGIAEIPDERLWALEKIFNPPKITPATMEFVDIAGLVAGASKGEGLGNQFLSHIREMDAIIHVVRCFKNPDVAHHTAALNPQNDIEIINTELLLADLERVEAKLAHSVKKLQTGDKSLAAEVELLKKLKENLEKGNSLRTLKLSENEKELINTFHLLTHKPVLYVANMGEDQPLEKDPRFLVVQELAQKEGSQALALWGKLEEELKALPLTEAQEYLSSLGVPESGLAHLAHISYKLLNLVTFFTVYGGKELRAWTILAGTKTPQAAGKIHSDMEKGFVKAEIIASELLIKKGSMAAAKEEGLLRIEGKEYVVKDGDLIHFRFTP